MTTNIYVTSGVTSSGITIDQNGGLYVESGGTAISTVVIGYTNAIEVVDPGGIAISTLLVNGGREAVYFGGTASSTDVTYGGVEYLYSGGTAIGTTISSGGSQDVRSDGTAISTTVSKAGGQGVESGGVAIDTTVTSGGIAQIALGAREIVSAGSATSVTIDNGGAEDVYSGGTAISTIVDRDAGVFVYAGGSASFTRVSSGGYLVVLPGGEQTGTTGSGAVVSTGIVLDAPESAVSAHGSFASGLVVDNGGTEYVLPGGSAVSTTVDVGGAIDVTYLSYTSGGSATVNTSGVLSVSVGGQAYTQQLSGNYAGERFTLRPDTGSGTLLMANAPCYGSGTRILTDRGEVAVDELLVGDLVQTMLGEGAAPIIWIGRREVDCAGRPKPREVWPVRVAAGAFGPGRPHSELFLSPDHAVYVGDVLIPIRYLINGSTIVQVPMDRVTYYHLELPRHDVVLAQGLPAESFLDLKDGSNYANRPGPARLYPDYTARMWEAFGCARLIVTGPELAAARALVHGSARARTAA